MTKAHMVPSTYKIVAFTGHRPQHIPNPDLAEALVKAYVYQLFTEFGEDLRIISGMALGVDTWAAEEATRLGITWTAAIPFRGQESRWTEEQQAHYHELLEHAHKVIVVCKEYSPQAFQLRNEYMVDNADLIAAFYMGKAGGTRNCIEYAKKRDREIRYINPQKEIWT